jgi:hypothetical protein
MVFEGTEWEEKIPLPIAMAPVGVLRIFNLDGETATTMPAAKRRYRIFQVRQVAQVLRILRGQMEKDKSAAAVEWTRTTFSGLSRGWEDVKFLKERASSACCP